MEEIGSTREQWYNTIIELMRGGHLKYRKRKNKSISKQQEMAAMELLNHLNLNIPEEVELAEHKTIANFGRIGRKVTQLKIINKENYFIETESKEDYKKTFLGDIGYNLVKRYTPQEDIKRDIIKRVEYLSKNKYLKRLKDRDKTGVIDALFIRKNPRVDRRDFAFDLYIVEWKKIFEQSTKLALMQNNLTGIPLLKADKYYYYVFNKEKINNFMGKISGIRIDSKISYYLWNIGIKTAVGIIDKTLYNKKKKQLDYITLTSLYHYLLDYSKQRISLRLFENLEHGHKNKAMTGLNKFCGIITQEYRRYFKYITKFEKIYSIPNKTFNRRRKNFVEFWENICKEDFDFADLKNTLYEEFYGIPDI